MKPEWYQKCDNRHQQPGAIVTLGSTPDDTIVILTNKQSLSMRY